MIRGALGERGAPSLLVAMTLEGLGMGVDPIAIRPMVGPQSWMTMLPAPLGSVRSLPPFHMCGPPKSVLPAGRILISNQSGRPI